MKKRFKILTSLIAPISVVPAIFVSAGCSKDRYAKLAQLMFDNTMQEFYDICKVYRPTFETEEIARHINDKVYEMDLACYDDWEEVQKHKSEWAPGTKHTSGNLMVRLEATPGYENAPKIILQAHMDMVCDGFSGGIVTPVIEGDILHSKDWKTSLGADDGIGIATMLSIIKYRDQFNHGPIRCIFTADEEDGEGCAHWLQDSWINNVDYIINLDHESIDDVGISCAGVQQCNCRVQLDKAEVSDPTYKDFRNCYEIKVEGVNGGSSGFALENNPIFAIKLAFELLDKMYKDSTEEKVQAGYIITDIRTDEEQSNGGGSISQNCTIQILSTLDSDNISDRQIITSMMLKAKNHVIAQRAQHPSEIGLKTYFSRITDTASIPVNGITPEKSKLVTQLFSKDELLFGEIKQPSTTTLTTCTNAGPITISESNNADKKVVEFETFGRTSLEDVLGPDPSTSGYELDGFMKYYTEKIQEIVGAQQAGWIQNIGWNPCWEAEPSKFTDHYKAYAARGGKPIGDFRAMGWAETAELVHKAKDLGLEVQASCIGPTIVDGHTKNGYCLVSSIKEMIERLVYGIEKICQQ